MMVMCPKCGHEHDSVSDVNEEIEDDGDEDELAVTRPKDELRSEYKTSEAIPRSSVTSANFMRLRSSSTSSTSSSVTSTSEDKVEPMFEEKKKEPFWKRVVGDIYKKYGAPPSPYD
jgi:hypothetical protein